MPTARELLEQAEALMRRDRIGALTADDDFPLLTDAVPDIAVGDVAATSKPVEIDVEMSQAAEAETGAPATLESSPATVDVAPPDLAVARLVSEHIEVAEDQQGEPSIWVVPANDAATITETGPDSLSPLAGDTREGVRQDAMDGDALWRDEALDGAPEVRGSAASGAKAVADVSPVEHGEDIVAPVDDFPLDATLDATRWNLMAEDIRMQVLQRIDIFTDTGLREQLKERLQPVVDRASADLVAAINQHVGQILREYVAEAIEREIEKWRQEPR